MKDRESKGGDLCGREVFAMAPKLKFAGKVVYFRKAICTPDIGSESVLTKDNFLFASLWLKRNCKEALPYWKQAENYYFASQEMPLESAPLLSYYCFLNATKALLIVKGRNFTDRHGVSGNYDPNSKRSLANEIVTIQNSGILASLSQYLDEPETDGEHSVRDLLMNLSFIHRAFRHTLKSKRELFIPISDVVYRKHPNDHYIWVTAEIKGRMANKKTLKTLPSELEFDPGYGESCVIRSKKRAKWFDRGDSNQEKEEAIKKLHSLHKEIRLYFAPLSAPKNLWYLKRNVSGQKTILRYNMTIIMAVMHRLSELSRYDPQGLATYLDGQPNWLLSEFIRLAPFQFLDEMVCEMTSLELRVPGVRP